MLSIGRRELCTKMCGNPQTPRGKTYFSQGPFFHSQLVAMRLHREFRRRGQLRECAQRIFVHYFHIGAALAPQAKAAMNDCTHCCAGHTRPKLPRVGQSICSFVARRSAKCSLPLPKSPHELHQPLTISSRVPGRWRATATRPSPAPESNRAWRRRKQIQSIWGLRLVHTFLAPLF